MVVETRYAAGSGLLLGADAHWLLVTDPGDEDAVERLWSAMGEGPRAAGQVLDIVEATFGGEPPALVLIDLTPDTGQTISLGSGRVHVEGPVRLLSLGDGAPEASGGPLRRFIGGVVGAHRAEIRTLSSPAPGAHVSTAPARSPGMIDGIPPSILTASGPDGPPAPRPRRPHPATATGIESGPRDTSEPDPLFMQRIVGAAAEITESKPYDVAGGHSTTTGQVGTPAGDTPPAGVPRPDDTGEFVDQDGSMIGPRPAGGAASAASAAAAAAAGKHDHDGPTVFRSGGPDHLRSTTGETVRAVWCPEGHLTPPDSSLCRVCRAQVAPQAAQRVPRPTLGGLRLPTGEVVPLDRGVILGRRPAPIPGTGDWPHLVHLSAEHTYVSRMHVQIELDGWLVIARDLGSRGGTTLRVPGHVPEKMRAHESYVLDPGQGLDLGDVYEVRYEVGPEVAL